MTVLCNCVQVRNEIKRVRRDVRKGFTSQILWVINSTNWCWPSFTKFCCHSNMIWWGSKRSNSDSPSVRVQLPEQFPFCSLYLYTNKYYWVLWVKFRHCTFTATYPATALPLDWRHFKAPVNSVSMSALVILDVSHSCGEGIRLRSQLRIGSHRFIFKHLQKSYFNTETWSNAEALKKKSQKGKDIIKFGSDGRLGKQV